MDGTTKNDNPIHENGSSSIFVHVYSGVEDDFD